MLRHFAYVLPVLVLGEAHHVEDPVTKLEINSGNVQQNNFVAILKVVFPEKSPKSPRVTNQTINVRLLTSVADPDPNSSIIKQKY